MNLSPAFVPTRHPMLSWVRVAVAVSLSSLCFHLTARAQSFAGAVSYAAGGSPQGIAAADVNADGLADLLVANSSANTLSVLLNQVAQPGTFATAPASFSTKGLYPVALAVGDVNGDTYPDVVLVNETSSTVSVLLNTNSPALFAPASVYGSGSLLPRGIALGDVNKDGLLDIVLAATVGNKIGVLLNSPTAPGTFQAAQLYPSGGTRPEGLAVSDVDGDGQLDIIVANQTSNSVGVLLNSTQSPGTFATPVSYATGGTSPRALLCRDVNLDGLSDILVTNMASGTVSVLLNYQTAAGTFLPATAYATAASGPVGLGAGDITGDGLPDVIVADYEAKTGTTISILSNSTAKAAVFSSAARLYRSGGTGPHDVTVGDFNGDGRLDIATSNFGSNVIGVLLNTGKF
ncbi:FG-GAP repeat domain-containing protein [Hymenobacter baengnokdamensis]|uniref:FG-GAP repeat domain-containing protein n=1 Tax=Hymenobacter baengnokdamensis TaxID=2615203 RepID=UPI00124620B9|nr:VCBS repeat-containing protein [Hymenobacter baengnokdamensis]